MRDATRDLIIEHARAEYPREACGLLLEVEGVEEYYPCQNLAKSNDFFHMRTEDYIAAEERGKIVAVVHSHPDSTAKASAPDKAACEASGLPWHIVSFPGLQWDTIIPSGYQAPLIGREWCHGVFDCYAIVRDWYKQVRGIELMNVSRSDNWWHNGEDLFRDNLEKAGFVYVDDSPQVGDLILMQVLANVPNHSAIYLGDDIILHHLYNRLSCREAYQGYWRKHTVGVLRYGKEAENSFTG